MSFLSMWNAFNNIGSYLLGGVGDKRQIILSCNDDKFVIPVTPRTYKVQTEQNNRVVDIIDYGEAQLFGNPKLVRLSFSCFFPQPLHNYPFVVGDAMSPSECVEKIINWKESKQPVRVIITNSPVNLMMAIKSFDYQERDGSRDIYYDLNFIEWKDLNTPLANNEKQIEEKTGLKQRPTTRTASKAAEAIKRSRDIVEASRRAYGKVQYWRAIANKNSLKNLALRNLRQLIIKERKKNGV